MRFPGRGLWLCFVFLLIALHAEAGSGRVMVKMNSLLKYKTANAADLPKTEKVEGSPPLVSAKPAPLVLNSPSPAGMPKSASSPVFRWQPVVYWMAAVSLTVGIVFLFWRKRELLTAGVEEEEEW